MTLSKNDFIEIEFMGKTKDGKVFDSNTAAGLAQIEGADVKNAKPFIFSIGHDMFLKGIDDFLVGKEIGKTYAINLNPADAFGARDPKKVQLMPIKIFNEQKVRPIPGAMFNFDGNIAKILSVNGGRVMADFNNPLAGKDLVYEVKVIRKVDDIKEKAEAFGEFLFRKKINFEIKEKKIILKVEEMLLQFAPMFKEKYKEVLGLDLEVMKSN